MSVKISYFKIMGTGEYLHELEQFIQNEGQLDESILNKGLKHFVLSFVLEKASRLAVDLMTEQRDIYSGQSQRFVRYAKNNLEFYIPKRIRSNHNLKKKYSDLVKFTIDSYIQLIKIKIPEEDARFIFPRCIESNMKFTITGEKLIEFFSYLINNSYTELNEIGYNLIGKLKKIYPNISENIITIINKRKSIYSKINNIEKIFLSKNFSTNPIIQAYTKDPIIECALGATVCYNRGSPTEYFDDMSIEDKINLIKFIKKVGHYSVLEHAFLTISFSMSEISHQQLRRHRLPMRSSTRLEWIVKNFDYVIPPSIKSNEKALSMYNNAMDRIKIFVDELNNMNILEYETMYILPNGTKIDVVLTTNFRDIIHILELRLCQRAQWEVRRWAYNLLEKLINKFPVIFSDIGPPCYKSKCHEGKYSCGHPEIFKKWRENVNENMVIGDKKNNNDVEIINTTATIL